MGVRKCSRQEIEAAANAEVRESLLHSGNCSSLLPEQRVSFGSGET